MPTELFVPSGEENSEFSQQVSALRTAGDQDAARKYCEDGFQRNPADPVVTASLAAILLDQNRPSDALAVLSTHRAANPVSFCGYLNTGVVLMSTSRSPEATEMFRRAAELGPGSPEAHFLLAESMGSLAGDPEVFSERREHFRIAAELRPDWAEAHFGYGMNCLYSSREAESEAALRKAAALRPDNAEIHFQLAYILLEQDRVIEATEVLKRVIEIDPAHGKARESLAQISKSAEKVRAVRLARYPRAAKEFADLRHAIQKYILTEFPDPEAMINPQTRVFTLGSCFAYNIAMGLRQQGVAAACVGYAEDINSTFANRYFLEWIDAREHPLTKPFQEFFGADYRQQILDSVTHADVVIISLGVAPCFFNRQTGDFVPMLGSNFQVSLRLKECVFRTTTVSENVANLQAIVAVLRHLNPTVKVVITVSPVPLKATFERRSAVVADCISKSTLRVAAHEFQQIEAGKVLYWPSFEIVRWFGGHFAQVFGNDDGSPFHVSQQVVNTIIECFIRTFGSVELRARLDRERQPAPLNIS